MSSTPQRPPRGAEATAPARATALTFFCRWFEDFESSDLTLRCGLTPEFPTIRSFLQLRMVKSQNIGWEWLAKQCRFRGREQVIDTAGRMCVTTKIWQFRLNL